MNQEESEQNEVDGIKKGADSTGKVMHVLKERLVICNEEDIQMVDRRGTGRVITDEERVLRVYRVCQKVSRKFLSIFAKFLKITIIAINT